MKLKCFAAACAVLAASYAAPSHAAGFAGYYLATFKYPGGTFAHCFQLTKTNSYPGYTTSGNWVDTDFPNTAGTYVVYKKTIHLAGYVGDPNGTDFLTLDGQVSGGTLINTTFDYFDNGGIYYAAGSFVEVRDPADCKPAS